MRRIALLTLFVLALAYPAAAMPTHQFLPATNAAVAVTFAVASSVLAFAGGPRINARASATLKRARLTSSPRLAAIGVDLEFANKHLQPHTYEDLEAELDSLMVIDEMDSRPPQKVKKATGAPSDGTFVNPIVADRLIPIVDDKRLHFLDALTKTPAGLAGKNPYALPASCKAALAFMLDKGATLPKWRAQQVKKLKSIANKLDPLDRALKALPLAAKSESVRMLDTGVPPLGVGVRSVNVALLCLMGDCMQHPDILLPRQFLTGFNVTGIVADSGVLRPQLPDGSEADFWQHHAATMRTNNAWAETLANDVASEQKSARGQRLSLLKQVWRLTVAEIADGFSGHGMTLKQLRSKYGSGSGSSASLSCRVLGRHGLRQGQKQKKTAEGVGCTTPDGNPILIDKIRLIDDSKRSLSNRFLMRCCETIAPCRFTYVATLAQELLSQSQKLGQRKPPMLVFCMDDMW